MQAIRDENHVTVALGVSSSSATTPLPFKIDSATGRLLTTSASGSGDVVGPASSTDNAIARFDGTTGLIIQDSVVLIADTTGNISGPQQLTLSGTTSGTAVIKPTAISGSAVLTLPAATDTLVGKNTTDILTNKTLVAPALGTPSSGVVNNLTGVGGQFTMSRIGASTYSTIQDMANLNHSAGFTSGGAVTDAGGATINVAAGTGFIRATNSNVAEILFIDWSASAGLAITADSIRYVGVEYNAGTPQVVIRTTYNFNDQTDFFLATVVNEGGVLYITKDPHEIIDHAGQMIKRTYETMGIKRDEVTGGLALGETGTRNITVSAGSLWSRLNEFPITALNTSVSGGFDTYAGTVLQATDATQWNNTQYNLAGTLTALSNNNFGNLWFYAGLADEIMVVYGTGDYGSQAEAQAASRPTTVPNRIIANGILIARLTFKKSAATVTSISSAFTNTFASGSVSNHSTLSNLAWTASGHTGTATRIAAFNGSGAAAEYTLSGTGTVLPTTASPTFTGNVTMPGTGIWNSSGNVGIGTVSPSYKIDAAGTISSSTGLVQSELSSALDGSTFPVLQVNSTTNSNSFTAGAILGAIDFASDDASFIGTRARIALHTTNTTNSFNELSFWTYSSGLNEVARMDRQGNFIVGRSDATTKLEVSGDSGTTNVESTAFTTTHRVTNVNTTNNNYSNFEFATKDAVGTVSSTSKISGVHTSHTTGAVSGDLVMLTSNAGTMTERVRILAAGNVGIGTTAPGNALQVYNAAAIQALFNGWSPTQGAGTTTGAIAIGDNASYRGVISYSGSGSATPSLYIDNTYNSDAGNIYFRTRTVGTPVDVMTILGSGNVGIGTTAPSDRLTLDGTDGTAYLRLKTAIATTGARIGFNGDDLKIDHEQATGDMVFDVNNAEAMRIQGGNVGIGTTTPGAKLHLVDAAGPSIRLVRDDANDYRFDISTDGANMNFTAQDSGGFTFAGTAVTPSTNNGAALGTTTLQWSDLHLASGAVINFANGNATLTHSTGIITSNVAFSVGTSQGITAGTIELGHATDTTLSRSAAGTLAVEGVNILTTATGLALAGGTMTGDITLGENTSIALDPAGSADGKYTGITITGTAGATLAFGDLIYLAVADSRWELADADALATAGNVMMGMCVLAAAADASATNVLLVGQIRADAKFPALTIGAAVYAGETAGAIQVAIPTGADNVIRVVGFALTADEIYFNPSQDHQTTVA